MRRLLAGLVVAWLALTASQAQVLEPVRWSCSVAEQSDSVAEVRLTADLSAGWHLYSQHSDPAGPQATTIRFAESKAYRLLGPTTEPKPDEAEDEMFGCVVKSFGGRVTFRQRVQKLSHKDFSVSGTVSFQLCGDGMCIAPDDWDFSVLMKGAPAKAVSSPADEAANKPPVDTASQTATSETTPHTTAFETDDNATDVPEQRQSLWGYFLIAIGAGLLTMFTPCVFPMIPMTVNFFMRSQNRRKGRRQAWFFGASIVLLFAVVGGVLSAIFGPEQLNTLATNWIPNLIFFVIFLLFALSFFGLFEIKMPERWVNGSDAQADKGDWLAPFFIALTTVLVSFSCTGPIIGGALAGLATDAGSHAATANRWVSLVAMSGFGIGFALPFTLLAMFPQYLKNMKSGAWLNTVKISFAFLELAFGLKFLQMADIDRNWGLLPRDLYIALWIAIFGLWGLYLLGKIRFKGDGVQKEIGVGRLLLAMADLAFVVYLIPGLWGAELKALSGFLPPLSSQQFNLQQPATVRDESATAGLPADRKYADRLAPLTPAGLQAFYDIEEATAFARRVGKPLLIDFTGKNCANCREMEHYVWSDPDVKRLMAEQFVICSLFTDENTITLPETEWTEDDRGRTLKTLGRRNSYFQRITYGVNAQPYYIIADAEGHILTNANYKYDRDAERFADWLKEGLNNYKP